MPDLWMLLVAGTEVQHVQIGSTVTLGCESSYLYETTWLKHNPELPPTVVLYTSLRDGHVAPGFQLTSRFSVDLTNRSVALKISGLEERDLGLYYCITILNKLMKVGRGTRLQARHSLSTSPPSPSSASLCPLPVTSSFSSLRSPWLFFYQCYCVVVVFGLLTMVLAVCVTHWKTNKAIDKRAV